MCREEEKMTICTKVVLTASTITQYVGTKKRLQVAQFSLINTQYSQFLVNQPPSAFSEASVFARLRWQKAAASTQGRADSFRNRFVAVLHFLVFCLALRCVLFGIHLRAPSIYFIYSWYILAGVLAESHQKRIGY